MYKLRCFIKKNSVTEIFFEFRDIDQDLPLDVPENSYDSSHTKAFLLFEAHFARYKLPSSDYKTDLKSVLDQAFRILQVGNIFELWNKA